jgi:hypothetical protein
MTFVFEKVASKSMVISKKLLILILKVTDENTSIRIQSRIRSRRHGSRSGSVPKCQGYTTLRGKRKKRDQKQLRVQ